MKAATVLGSSRLPVAALVVMGTLVACGESQPEAQSSTTGGPTDSATTTTVTTDAPTTDAPGAPVEKLSADNRLCPRLMDMANHDLALWTETREMLLAAEEANGDKLADALYAIHWEMPYVDKFQERMNGKGTPVEQPITSYHQASIELRQAASDMLVAIHEDNLNERLAAQQALDNGYAKIVDAEKTILAVCPAQYEGIKERPVLMR